jgi:hypothetical protein
MLTAGSENLFSRTLISLVDVGSNPFDVVPSISVEVFLKAKSGYSLLGIYPGNISSGLSTSLQKVK